MTFLEGSGTERGAGVGCALDCEFVAGEVHSNSELPILYGVIDRRRDTCFRPAHNTAEALHNYPTGSSGRYIATRVEWRHQEIEWQQLNKIKMLGTQTCMVPALSLAEIGILTTGLSGGGPPRGFVPQQRRKDVYPDQRGRRVVTAGRDAHSPKTWTEKPVEGFLDLPDGDHSCAQRVRNGFGDLKAKNLQAGKERRNSSRHCGADGELLSVSIYVSPGGAMASLGSQLVRTPTDVIAQRLMIQGNE
eukprot:1371397-Amorphochlora_amoeboformis.AAC.2